MTAQTIINTALRRIGRLGLGQAASGPVAILALDILNELQDKWNGQHLTSPTLARTVYALTANVGTYTVGATGTLVGPRPVHLKAASTMAGATGLETFLDEPLTRDQYIAVLDKSLTSAQPRQVYVEPTPGPNGTVILLPTPTSALRLVLYVEQQLTRFADLTTDYSLKEGYERAYKTNLAVALATEFGRPVPAELAIAADNAFLQLIENNQALDVPELDGTGGFGVGEVFDGTSGEFR